MYKSNFSLWAAFPVLAFLLAARSAEAAGATPTHAIPPLTAATPAAAPPHSARHPVAAPPSIVMLPRPGQVFTTKQIADWVSKLSSPHITIRRQAKHHLIAAGTAAVAALKAALAGWTTPQMRRDMHAVLAAIARAHAIRGPLVTLKLTNAPLRIILRQLCRQAGLTAQFAGTRLHWTSRRLNIRVQHQPFWKVIQQIAYVTGIRPCGNDFYTPVGLFSFCRHGSLARHTPVYRCGALLLAIQASSAGETIRFTAPPAQHAAGGFGVNLMGFWAPGGTAIEQVGPVQFTQALDNRGKSLLASMVSQNCYTSNSCDEFTFAPRLYWPSPHATKLTVLAGEVPVVLDSGPRIWRISRQAFGKAALTFHGLHIAIGKPTDVVTDPLNPQIGRCHIMVSISSDAGARLSPTTAGLLHAISVDLPSIFGPNIGGVLGFTGTRGQKLQCRVGRAFKGPNWSHIIHIQGGLPVTAWVKLHTGLSHVRIPFIFHNVPLPKGCSAESRLAAAPQALQHPRTGPATLIMPAHKPARPATPVTANRLAQWIHQLNSANAKHRATARRNLIRSGPAATIALRHALHQARRPLFRARLASVMDTIETANILQGPLVSLHLKHPTVQTVIRQLCLQAGLLPHLDQVPPLNLTSCNISCQPFWKVLRQLAHVTGIGPTGRRFNNYQPIFGSNSLLSDSVPISIHGAGAVALSSLHRFENHWLTNVGSGNPAQGFNAHFFVLWAPTPRQILEQIGGLYGTETITDAHSKIVLSTAFKTTQNCYPQTPQDGVFPLTVALHQPPSPAAALALRGWARIYVSSDIRTLHVNNIGFGHAALQDQAMNLVFGTLTQIPGGWQIPLRISTLNFFYHGKTNHWLAFAAIPLEHRFIRGLFAGREVRFYSTHGHLLHISAHAGGPVLSHGWGYYRYTINVIGGKPTRANIRFFTRTLLVKLPFNFTHLPVPR